MKCKAKDESNGKLYRIEIGLSFTPENRVRNKNVLSFPFVVAAPPLPPYRWCVCADFHLPSNRIAFQTTTVPPYINVPYLMSSARSICATILYYIFFVLFSVFSFVTPSLCLSRLQSAHQTAYQMHKIICVTPTASHTI